MPVAAHSRTDDDGLYIRVAGLAPHVEWLLMLRYPGVQDYYVQATWPALRNDSGELALTLAAKGGLFRAFIPTSAVDGPSGHAEFDLCIGPADTPRRAYKKHAREPTENVLYIFRVTWHLSQTSAGAVYRPVAGLLSCLTHADGSPDAARRSRLRDAILSCNLIPFPERPALADLAQFPPPDDVGLFWRVVRSRFPLTPAAEVADVLEKARDSAAFGSRASAALDELLRSVGLKHQTGTRSSPADESLLNVPPGATRDQLRKAWHERAKEFHPDKYAKAPDEIRKFAEAKVSEIRAAYERLVKNAPEDSPPLQPGPPIPDADRLG